MGVALLALFAFPFILIGRASKKNKKQLLGKLTSLAEKNGCTIKETDRCGEFAIGIDNEEKVLFSIKTGKYEERAQIVKLNDFRTVRVINQNKTLSENGSRTFATTNLALQFVPGTKDKNEVQVEFYNIEDKNQMTHELELLNKWNDLLMLKLK